MRKKQQLTNTGLSLIEVCISIVLVLIILVSMVRIFSQGYRYLRKSKVNTVAHNLARQFTEDYSNWDTLDDLDCVSGDGVINTVPGSPYSSSNPPACGAGSFVPITLNNVTYTPTLTIADGPSYPTELKQIDVTILWHGSSLNLVSLVADF